MTDTEKKIKKLEDKKSLLRLKLDQVEIELDNLYQKAFVENCPCDPKNTCATCQSLS